MRLPNWRTASVASTRAQAEVPSALRTDTPPSADAQGLLRPSRVQCCYTLSAAERLSPSARERLRCQQHGVPPRIGENLRLLAREFLGRDVRPEELAGAKPEGMLVGAQFTNLHGARHDRRPGKAARSHRCPPFGCTGYAGLTDAPVVPKWRTPADAPPPGRQAAPWLVTSPGREAR